MCENFSRIIRELKDEGRIEGRIEGRNEGIFKEKIATIQRLCEMNMAIDMIAKITQLSVDEVMKIMAEHQISYVH